MDRQASAGKRTTNREIYAALHSEAVTPDHPHVKRLRVALFGASILGIISLIILPANLFIHTVAFAATYSFLPAIVVNLLVKKSGEVLWSRVIGCAVILLLFGGLTAAATGDGMWSWSPWMNQLYPQQQ